MAHAAGAQHEAAAGPHSPQQLVAVDPSASVEVKPASSGPPVPLLALAAAGAAAVAFVAFKRLGGG